MKGLIALSPLAVFVALYLVTSLVVGDFYKVPITVAFLFASIYAIAIARGQSLPERIKVFGRGAGSEGVMMMLWIFILAGAFANSAKELGCIDATVAAALAILPPEWIVPGCLFHQHCHRDKCGNNRGTRAHSGRNGYDNRHEYCTDDGYRCGRRILRRQLIVHIRHNRRGNIDTGMSHERQVSG